MHHNCYAVGLHYYSSFCNMIRVTHAAIGWKKFISAAGFPVVSVQCLAEPK
jgi:hypothetical protein